MSALTTLAFTPNIEQAPGFDVHNAVAVKKLCRSSVRGKNWLRVNNHPSSVLIVSLRSLLCPCAARMPQLSLGQPAVNGDIILLGTDNPQAQSNHLFCLNGNAMQSATTSPLLSTLSLDEVSAFHGARGNHEVASHPMCPCVPVYERRSLVEPGHCCVCSWERIRPTLQCQY